MEENNISQNSKKNGWMLPVLVLLVVVGGFVFVNRQQTTETKVVSTSTMTDENKASESAPIMVEGGMFYYEPNEIRVKKGETVKITFTNVEGKHDFVIDEFNVQTAELSENESETFEFVADQTGEFEFYCSVTDHRAMGMTGKLIVED